MKTRPVVLIAAVTQSSPGTCTDNRAASLFYQSIVHADTVRYITSSNNVYAALVLNCMLDI